MIGLVWLIPALPLAGFVVLTLAGRRFGEPAAGWLAMLWGQDITDAYLRFAGLA